MRYRSRRSNNNRISSWETSVIRKIYKCVNVNNRRTSISNTAMNIMVSMMRDLTLRILIRSKEILNVSNKKTLTARHVQFALRLELSNCGELMRHAVSEGTKAVCNNDKYSRGTGGGDDEEREKKPAGGAPQQGKIVKPSKIKLSLKRTDMFQRVSKDAYVYLAAVIEYLASEVLELSYNNCTNAKKSVSNNNQNNHNNIAMSSIYLTKIIIFLFIYLSIINTLFRDSWHNTSTCPLDKIRNWMHCLKMLQLLRVVLSSLKIPIKISTLQ
ncbi:histone H2B domain-containing protein [Heterostelium album PN500]|uniref:Histone H2A n=1 Tax=Heterostelium pallidum (strain ATCC 26659 / Pp 5 / PN500) TaxID=670386 RepID=D3AVM0_HETP5|nr:histone H2B domain-containing protein [Heterostelium album PN500]EFA86343.1 histone H2B domain-containing protein [Heterostelium album PN500]|eukprot:XP_020438448.1 histone H2B domain-containing protein [Heterostelium album PN500]